VLVAVAILLVEAHDDVAAAVDQAVEGPAVKEWQREA
tara:strand:+ start:1055 stop:1165 length:111 start_codon:yes stop_codon:yes gene_type:complete